MTVVRSARGLHAIARREPSLLIPNEQPSGNVTPPADDVLSWAPWEGMLGFDLSGDYAATAHTGDPAIVQYEGDSAVYAVNDILQIGPAGIDLSGGYTITWRGEITSFDDWGGVFVLPANSGATNHIVFQRSSSTAVLRIYHGVTSIDLSIATTDLQSAKHTVSITWDGARIRTVLDGVLKDDLAFTTTPDTTGGVDGVYLFCERNLDTAFGTDGYCTAFEVKAEPTSAAELVDQHHHLYQDWKTANDSPYLISVAAVTADDVFFKNQTDEISNGVGPVTAARLNGVIVT